MSDRHTNLPYQAHVLPGQIPAKHSSLSLKPLHIFRMFYMIIMNQDDDHRIFNLKQGNLPRDTKIDYKILFGIMLNED